MVYFKSDNIISPIGMNTSETFSSLINGETGINLVDNKDYYPEPFPASIIDDANLETKFIEVAGTDNNQYTKLEKMIIVSITDALSDSDVDIKSHRTAIILSTTKGNIDLLDESKKSLFENDRVLCRQVQLDMEKGIGIQLAKKYRNNTNCGNCLCPDGNAGLIGGDGGRQTDK